MDQLKEQLKKHYEKTQPREEFLQSLRTLEAPEPAPVPVRTSRKRRLLTPIAAMLIAAVALLGGGKYLMDAMPPTAVPPTAVVPVESAADFEDVAPTDMASDPEPDIMSAAPEGPVTVYTEETPPEKTAPEQDSSGVTAPQPPTSAEPTDPAPPDDITDPAPPPPQPPIEGEGSVDDPTPPPEEDVPPNDPGEGNEDDPPTDPGDNDPADPPDDPVDPPDDPVDPPDEPTDPSGKPIIPAPPPEITGRYAYEFGQHMVYLTNCDTGESSSLNLTTQFTGIGYYGTHSLFGYMVAISLIEPTWELVPTSDYVFSVVAEVVM